MVAAAGFKQTNNSSPFVTLRERYFQALNAANSQITPPHLSVLGPQKPYPNTLDDDIEPAIRTLSSPPFFLPYLDTKGPLGYDEISQRNRPQAGNRYRAGYVRFRPGEGSKPHKFYYNYNSQQRIVVSISQDARLRMSIFTIMPDSLKPYRSTISNPSAQLSILREMRQANVAVELLDIIINQVTKRLARTDNAIAQAKV